MEVEHIESLAEVEAERIETQAEAEVEVEVGALIEEAVDGPIEA